MWAPSSIPSLSSPAMMSFNQVNICTAVYHQCHSSGCQQYTHEPRAEPAVTNTQNKAEIWTGWLYNASVKRSSSFHITLFSSLLFTEVTRDLSTVRWTCLFYRCFYDLLSFTAQAYLFKSTQTRQGMVRRQQVNPVSLSSHICFSTVPRRSSFDMYQGFFRICHTLSDPVHC